MGYWTPVIGYLLGSIPFGVLVARAAGRDILTSGSGNTGATNALRVVGWPGAVVVLAGDIGKGLLAAWIGLQLAGPAGLAAGGVGAALGHAYSLFLRGRGGKVVAVTLGLAALMDWRMAVVAVAVFLLVVASTRIVSLGSIAGASAAGAAAFWLPLPPAYRVAMVLLWALLVWRHRPNIERLLHGQERRLGAAK